MRIADYCNIQSNGIRIVECHVGSAEDVMGIGQVVPSVHSEAAVVHDYIEAICVQRELLPGD